MALKDLYADLQKMEKLPLPLIRNRFFTFDSAIDDISIVAGCPVTNLALSKRLVNPRDQRIVTLKYLNHDAPVKSDAVFDAVAVHYGLYNEQVWNFIKAWDLAGDEDNATLDQLHRFAATQLEVENGTR